MDLLRVSPQTGTCPIPEWWRKRTARDTDWGGSRSWWPAPRAKPPSPSGKHSSTWDPDHEGIKPEISNKFFSETVSRAPERNEPAVMFVLLDFSVHPGEHASEALSNWANQFLSSTICLRRNTNRVNHHEVLSEFLEGFLWWFALQGSHSCNWNWATKVNLLCPSDTSNVFGRKRSF